MKPEPRVTRLRPGEPGGAQLLRNLREVGLLILIGFVSGALALALDSGIHFLYRRIYSLSASSDWELAGRSFVALSIGSLIAGYLTHRVCFEARGSGIAQMKEAYRKHGAAFSFRAVYIKFISCVATVGSGLCLGRRGPSVFIGAAMGSVISDRLSGCPSFRRIACAAGSAAGLAAAFNTPLASITFFSEEVVNRLHGRRIIPSLVAVITAILTLYAVRGSEPVYHFQLDQEISIRVLLLSAPTAVAACVLAALFQRTLMAVWRHSQKTPQRLQWLLPVVGAWVVWLIGTGFYIAFHETTVFGLGDDALRNLLQDETPFKIVAALVAARFIGVAIAFGFGGCGGIFTPTLFLGAGAGAFMAAIGQIGLDLSPADTHALISVGMCASIAAIVRAPLTAMLMLFEMTHSFAILPALLLATIIGASLGASLNQTSIYDALSPFPKKRHG